MNFKNPITHHIKKEQITLDGKIHEVISYHDEHGNLLHKIISPLMIEFHPKDVLQVIVGATILAIPVSFTEETWALGAQLPLVNAIIILIISLLFIGSFTYYTYYRNNLKKHIKHFLKRTISTYIISFLIVSMILILIQKGFLHTELLTAIKRTIIVAFPASMSAAIADNLK